MVEIKHTAIKMKNALDGLVNTTDTAEERISEFEMSNR